MPASVRGSVRKQNARVQAKRDGNGAERGDIAHHSLDRQHRAIRHAAGEFDQVGRVGPRRAAADG